MGLLACAAGDEAAVAPALSKESLFQSCIDVVVEGGLEYGLESVREISRRQKFGVSLLNDRELARRPWAADDKYAAVDEMLAAAAPHFTDRRFPEQYVACACCNGTTRAIYVVIVFTGRYLMFWCIPIIHCGIALLVFLAKAGIHFGMCTVPVRGRLRWFDRIFESASACRRLMNLVNGSEHQNRMRRDEDHGDTTNVCCEDEWHEGLLTRWSCPATYATRRQPDTPLLRLLTAPSRSIKRGGAYRSGNPGISV